MAYTSSNVSCGIDNYLQCGYNKTRELMLKGEVFCGKSKDVPKCYASEKVTEWTISDTDEIVLYVK